jgi:hypothetical protein
LYCLFLTLREILIDFFIKSIKQLHNNRFKCCTISNLMRIWIEESFEWIYPTKERIFCWKKECKIWLRSDQISWYNISFFCKISINIIDIPAWKNSNICSLDRLNRWESLGNEVRNGNCFIYWIDSRLYNIWNIGNKSKIVTISPWRHFVFEWFIVDECWECLSGWNLDSGRIEYNWTYSNNTYIQANEAENRSKKNEKEKTWKSIAIMKPSRGMMIKRGAMKSSFCLLATFYRVIHVKVLRSW